MAITSRFLIIGDLHGRMPRIYLKNFDAVIAPGDFCSDQSRKYIFEAMRRAHKNPRFSKNWIDLAGKRKAGQILDTQVRAGRRILSRLNDLHKPVFMVPGNWDFAEDPTWHLMHADLDNLVDCHRRMVETDGPVFIGAGITSGPEYPVTAEMQAGYTKRQLLRQKKSFSGLLRGYNRLFRIGERTGKPIILLSHNVPFNTSLDLITDKRSPAFGKHYGSILARKLIEKWQPLACIGGHMHEHFTGERMGKTLCINAGFGSFVNVSIDIVGKRLGTVRFIRKGKTVEVIR